MYGTQVANARKQSARVATGIAMFALLGLTTAQAGEVYSQTSYQRASTGFSTASSALNVSVEHAGTTSAGAVRIQNASASEITVTAWPLSQPLVVAANSVAKAECSVAWGQTHVAASEGKNAGSVYVDVQCGDSVNIKGDIVRNKGAK
jgi:hypothetical protein